MGTSEKISITDWLPIFILHDLWVGQIMEMLYFYSINSKIQYKLIIQCLVQKILITCIKMFLNLSWEYLTLHNTIVRYNAMSVVGILVTFTCISFHMSELKPINSIHVRIKYHSIFLCCCVLAASNYCLIF